MFHAVQITLQHGCYACTTLLYPMISSYRFWIDNGTLCPILGARDFRADDRGIPQPSARSRLIDSSMVDTMLQQGREEEQKQ